MLRWIFALFAITITATQSALATSATQTAHWGGFPSPNGPVAEMVVGTYNIVFWISVAIYVLVQGVIIYAIFAFRKSKKRKIKDAKQFSHNTTLEVIWTVIPVIICVFIGFKAYQGISYIKNVPEDAIQVDVIGYQFNWDFDYPDLDISSPMVLDPHAELAQAGIRNPVKDIVVPQGKNVVLNITSKDVLHAVYVPALGIKADAIPGRITYSWFNATQAGDYLGQCAELCGANHGEMFFNVKVLPQPAWKAWVDTQRTEAGLKPLFAQLDEVTVKNTSIRVGTVREN